MATLGDIVMVIRERQIINMMVIQTDLKYLGDILQMITKHCFGRIQTDIQHAGDTCGDTCGLMNTSQ